MLASSGGAENTLPSYRFLFGHFGIELGSVIEYT